MERERGCVCVCVLAHHGLRRRFFFLRSFYYTPLQAPVAVFFGEDFFFPGLREKKTEGGLAARELRPRLEKGTPPQTEMQRNVFRYRPLFYSCNYTFLTHPKCLPSALSFSTSVHKKSLMKVWKKWHNREFEFIPRMRGHRA